MLVVRRRRRRKRLCACGASQAQQAGPSTSPLEGLFGRRAGHELVVLAGHPFGRALRFRGGWRHSFGARAALPHEPLWHHGDSRRRGRWRCAAARAGALCLGGFVCRWVSFEVGAARRRAVRQCQVNWVALFGGSGSPSNTRSRGPALRWKVGAAGAGRDCAPAAPARLSRPAPQLHR